MCGKNRSLTETELKEIHLFMFFFLLVISNLIDHDLTTIEWTSANSSDEIPNLSINFGGPLNILTKLTAGG